MVQTLATAALAHLFVEEHVLSEIWISAQVTVLEVRVNLHGNKIPDTGFESRQKACISEQLI